MKSTKIYSFIGNFTSFYDFLETITGYKKSVKYFVSQLPFPSDQNIKILDAGCGTGTYTFAILEQYKNAHITAFDRDEKHIEYLKRRVVEKNLENKVDAFVEDLIGSLSRIHDKKFDLILTSGVLVYVPHEETIRKLSHFLTSEGYFFNIPNRDSLWGRFVCRLYACKPYSREENVAVFERNGFELINNIKVPSTPTASFKDAHIFRKLT